MEADEVRASGVLDITGAQLDESLTPELNDVLRDESLVEEVRTFDATTNRLRRVPADVVQLPRLERLLLRKNLLPDMDFIGEMRSAANLVELVVYDNAISALPDTDTLAALERIELLDVSYNSLRKMRGIERIGGGRRSSRLRELYLAANKIEVMEGCGAHEALEVLELGSNRIRRIAGLTGLPKLRQLWLGRNKIAKLIDEGDADAASAAPELGPRGTACLAGVAGSLRVLSLQSNRLTSMDGLDVLVGLEELYLSHNGISEIRSVASMPRLRVLDISNNRIRTLRGLDSSALLEELWCNDNDVVDDRAELETNLSATTATLTTLYLENNPASAFPDYVEAMRALFPKLEELDHRVLR